MFMLRKNCLAYLKIYKYFTIIIITSFFYFVLNKSHVCKIIYKFPMATHILYRRYLLDDLTVLCNILTAAVAVCW